jgi:hypothetical protein
MSLCPGLMNVEVTCSSAALVYAHKSAWRNSLEDYKLGKHCCGNFKSYGNLITSFLIYLMTLFQLQRLYSSWQI